jgi:ABC-type branched-subunit amino acid transport system ATPase component
MLEIVRALAIEPSVLLLDEPLSGLNPDEIAHVLELVRGARAGGVTVLFVEHDLANLLAVADRFVVLDHGRKIAEGSPQTVVADPVVLEAYIGDEVA